MPETTAAGWGDGRTGAPGRDWKGSRIGPAPGAAFVQSRRDAEASILNACGAFAALFQANADGTSQREALRRLHLQTLAPVAKLCSAELTEKMEAPVSISFDLYGFDLAGRTQSFKRLVESGMAVTEALAISGLLGAAEAERD